MCYINYYYYFFIPTGKCMGNLFQNKKERKKVRNIEDKNASFRRVSTQSPIPLLKCWHGVQHLFYLFSNFHTQQWKNNDFPFNHLLNMTKKKRERRNFIESFPIPASSLEVCLLRWWRKRGKPSKQGLNKGLGFVNIKRIQDLYFLLWQTLSLT